MVIWIIAIANPHHSFCVKASQITGIVYHLKTKLSEAYCVYSLIIITYCSPFDLYAR